MEPHPRSKRPPSRKLSHQQKAFVAAYLEDLGASPSKAAERAKYKHPKIAAQKLLKMPHVKAAITARTTTIAKKQDISIERFLQEISTIGLRTVKDALNDEGQIDLSDLRNLPDDFLASIDGLEIDSRTDSDGETVQTAKIKLASKLTALRTGLEVLGAFDKGTEAGEKEKPLLDWEEITEDPRPGEPDEVDERIQRMANELTLEEGIPDEVDDES